MDYVMVDATDWLHYFPIILEHPVDIHVPLNPEQQDIHKQLMVYESVNVVATRTGKRFTIIPHYPEDGIRYYDVVEPDGTVLHEGLIMSGWNLEGWLSGLQFAPSKEG